MHAEQSRGTVTVPLQQMPGAQSLEARDRWTFYEVINDDGLVKSQNWDGKVKSSICQARKT